MHAIYELKDMLCQELEEIAEKGELTAGSLDTIDKLAHAIKNINKILEYEEEEGGYSNNDGMYYRDGGYSRDGGSYARGRGRNARRDSRGRYSRGGYPRNGGGSYGYSRADGADDMAEDLRDMMQDAPNDQVRQRIQSLITELERA